MKIDNWLLLDPRGSSFRCHTHSLIEFLKETEEIVTLRRKDLRHKEVVRASYMEFAMRVEREPTISDVKNKLEKLEREAKIQRDHIWKIDQVFAW